MQNNSNLSATGIHVRISDLLFAFQKRWMVIVSATMIGVVMGLIISAMSYVQSSFTTYEINGSFAVTAMNPSGLYINNNSNPSNNDYHLAEDMMDAVKYLIKSDHVFNDVINSQELLGYNVTQLKSMVSLIQYNTTQILEMKFNWPNAEDGIGIWNAIVEHASALLPMALKLGSLEVINEPTAEMIGMAGSGNKLAVLLALLGFGTGVGFAVIELLIHPTLNNVHDVETMFGLETIGVIPQDKEHYRTRGSILAPEDTGSSTVLQSFSAAAYILRNRLGDREKHHCFYVTSAISGEGKTTVAAHLAVQLSDMEHRTLLIDFDTRNPSLGALFLDKVDYARSLNALYRGDATEEEAITTLTGYLDLLPTMLEHNVISLDSTIVEMIQRLQEKYEYVILDAPSVGQVSDTLSLNQVANTVLFVVGYDISTIPDIQSALEKLDKSGTRVLGCVVNNVSSSRNLALGNNGEGRRKNSKDKKKAPLSDPAQKEEKSAAEEIMDGASQKKQKKGEKKPGLFSGRKKENQEAEPAPAAPAAKEVSGPKNIFEELIEQETKQEGKTDADHMAELLRMGITNDWGSDAEEMDASGSGYDTSAAAEEAVIPEADKPAEPETKAEESAPEEAASPETDMPAEPENEDEVSEPEEEEAPETETYDDSEDEAGESEPEEEEDSNTEVFDEPEDEDEESESEEDEDSETEILTEWENEDEESESEEDEDSETEILTEWENEDEESESEEEEDSETDVLTDWENEDEESETDEEEDSETEIMTEWENEDEESESEDEEDLETDLFDDPEDEDEESESEEEEDSETDVLTEWENEDEESESEEEEDSETDVLTEWENEDEESESEEEEDLETDLFDDPEDEDEESESEEEEDSETDVLTDWENEDEESETEETAIPKMDLFAGLEKEVIGMPPYKMKSHKKDKQEKKAKKDKQGNKGKKHKK
ncbi:MAG: AAA family ATPase [Clostridia bacterium]|nr:AAA family ATPase [Clostridia bacterium]